MNENETFYVDENGNVIYSEDSVPDSATVLPNEEEVVEDGDNVTENITVGTEVSDSVESEEVSEEVSETLETVYSGDTYNVSLLSDEVQAVVVDALTPASGSIGSSTLDYFDRIVSGLPSDYVYIAYRTDSDDSYSGVLYYSDNYDLNSNVVNFEEDTHVIEVWRTNSGSYNYLTYYSDTVVDGSSVAYDLSGSTLYYTNADIGYPVLGGLEKPLDLGSYISVGLLSVMALLILSKLFRK